MLVSRSSCFEVIRFGTIADLLNRVFDPPEDNPVQRFSRQVAPSNNRAKDQTFAFDRVFDENTTQADVYEATSKNLLDSVLDGYNATVFAYGATGCGKTHTIT
jgi:kinesin family protein 18/19